MDKGRWRFFGVLLSVVLAFAQVSIAPVAMASDNTKSGSSTTSNGSITPAATYSVGDQIVVSGSNIYYQVTDIDSHKVQIGTGSGFGNAFDDGVWPATHELTIPASVTDSSGAEWTVDSISDSAFRVDYNQTVNYLDKITIDANLSSIGNYAFSSIDYHMTSLVFNGTVKSIASASITDTYLGDFSFPEGADIVYKDNVVYSGAGMNSFTFPLSFSGNIWLTGLFNAMYVKSPYTNFNVTSPYKSFPSGNKANAYFWAGSNAQTTFDLYRIKNWKKVTGHAMAVLQEDAYTPAAVVPEGSAAYSCDSNVSYSIEDNATYTVAPTMTLTCTNAKYGWTLAEGTDYTTTYYKNGEKLDGAPTDPGTYSVQFVGNNKTAWGTSKLFTYTIDPDISKSIIKYDPAATSYIYDAAVHAPAIAVTLNGKALVEGTQYSVSYVNDSGTYASADKPSAPGNYLLLVSSKSPSEGGVIGQVPFTINSISLEGGSAISANIEATGSVVAPSISVYTSDGSLVAPAAYAITYADSNGTAVAAADLKDVGNYTATITGDGVGCTGSLTTSFSIVAAGKTLASATLSNGPLTYTGSTVTPTFAVLDGSGAAVDSSNYSVSYASSTGLVVAPADLKAAGTYTATITSTGTIYAGKTTCSFTIGSQDASAAAVTINKASYDYVPTTDWMQSSYTVGDEIFYKSQAVDPDITVKLGDQALVEGTDYTVSCTGDRVSSAEDNVDHTATFTVNLCGNYSGTLTSDAYKFTVNKRIAHVYEYKGVKFSYANDSDGHAIITGLGIDISSNTADFSSAYSENWDNKTITIPGTIVDNNNTTTVTGVSAHAFSLPYAGNSSSNSKDIFNGATKLVLEENIVEVGQDAFPSSKITELSLPEGLVNIHAGAFMGVSANVEKVVIPSTVKYIGTYAFCSTNDSSTLKQIVFSQPSQFCDSSEGFVMASTSGTTQVQGVVYGRIFKGGSSLKQDVCSPLESIVLPASIPVGVNLLADFPKLATIYYMADPVQGDVAHTSIIANSAEKSITLWGWDTVDSFMPAMVANKSAFNSFKPFAVLGDGYTYTNAYNSETGACDASKTYPGNVAVGTPVATNNGDSVTVDWNLKTNYVNSDYAWTPVEGTDFTVAYKDASGADVKTITQPGTYTATLTGNGVNCFGTTTAQVKVDAAQLTDADVAFASSDPITYNGKVQTPEVVVKNGETLLEPDTDYTVNYQSNVEAGTATATVTGKGLYSGTVNKTFTIAKAPIIVTASNATKVAGAADPALACTIDGLVNGDTAKGYTVARAAGETAGTYAITPSSVWIVTSDDQYASDNYTATYVPGTFTITAAPVDISTVTAAAISDQTYNGTEVRPSVSLTDANGTALVEGADYWLDYSNNNAVGTGTVVVNGMGAYQGTKTLTFAITEAPAESAVWTRLAGDSLYDTAAAISKAGFEKADTVLLATGENYPDALCASGLAGMKDAPILLTANKSALTAQTKAEISRLGAKNVIILGGTGVIADSVAIQLKGMGLSVTRLWGQDQYGTAMKIYEGEKSSGTVSKTAIIATGDSFADALSIAPYAYANHCPVFLTDKGVLNDDAVAAIKAGGFNQILIAGGPYVVSDKVKTQLGSQFAYTRVAGSSQYDTSAIIGLWETGKLSASNATGSFYQYASIGFTPAASEQLGVDGMAVATGENFPDALSGAALSGSKRAVLLLVNDSTAGRVGINKLVVPNAASITSGYVYGGTGVVSSNLYEELVTDTKK